MLLFEEACRVVKRTRAAVEAVAIWFCKLERPAEHAFYPCMPSLSSRASCNRASALRRLARMRMRAGSCWTCATMVAASSRPASKWRGSGCHVATSSSLLTHRWACFLGLYQGVEALHTALHVRTCHGSAGDIYRIHAKHVLLLPCRPDEVHGYLLSRACATATRRMARLWRRPPRWLCS